MEAEMTMLCSEEINEIASALAAAQGVIKNPGKTQINPHFRSRYADLAGGLECIRPALSKNGIAIVQATRIERDWVILTTRLVHSSGQYFGCEYPVAPVSADHQKMGGALTYAKRQSVFALAGVCGENDDLDGEDSKGVGNGALVSKEQVEALEALLIKYRANRGKYLQVLGVSGLDMIPAKRFAEATQIIEDSAARVAKRGETP